jgi:signal transduction histidine kinase
MPRLFKKFSSKSERGMGLGLFISKNIVEAHGGEIWADTPNKDKGAAFSFTIPID